MYKILVDYGHDGWRFQDEKFLSVGDAVKYASENVFYNKWLVVLIINWEAKEI